MSDEKKDTGKASQNREKIRKFYEKAKEFTRDVGGKISKQASIQKKNLDVMKLQERLAKTYRALGEKSFDYFKKNSPDNGEIKKELEEIKKLNSEIKSIKIKIGREKSGK